ncbi:MAG: ABC transporter permease subunit, partial [Candidatus Micrarchaeota archaeon]
ALFPFFILASLALTGDILLATMALILAGMQWYLLFNAIAGAKNMPNDFNEVSGVFHIRGWLYYRKVLLPAMIPSLITGSITAIGGGWNALVVAEYLEYGGKTYSSFGIGSLLSEATYKLADLKLIALTLVAMTLVIVLLNRLVWRPLYAYSTRRYRLDTTK